jgi:hypothetical protein
MIKFIQSNIYRWKWIGAALDGARGLSSLVTDCNDGRPRLPGGGGGGQDLSNDSAILIRNVNKDIIFFFE